MSGRRKADPTWEHGFRMPELKNGSICKYCGHQMRSGGVTRLKMHLAHLDPSHNMKFCNNVPHQVKEEMRIVLHSKTEAKAKKSSTNERN